MTPRVRSPLVSQFDTSSPEKLRADAGRAQNDLDQLLASLRQRYAPRLQTGARISNATPRGDRLLRLGTISYVTTVSGDADLYLPSAKPADLNARVAFVKLSASNEVRVFAAAGQEVEGSSSLSGLDYAGYYEFVWDGSAWWLTRSHALPQPTDDNQLLIASGGEWTLLDPPGSGLNYVLSSHSESVSWVQRTLRRHEADANTVGLWQFNGSLEDDSSTGADFSVTAGAIIYSDILPGFKMAWFDNTTTVAATAAALQITGDLTIEALVVLDAGPNGNPWISHGTAGELENANILYEAQIEVGRLITWFSEHGAGVNDTYAWAAPYGLSPVHQVFHLAHRRSSNVISNWVNGKQLGGDSTTLTAPTGGGTGSLVVGGSSAAAAFAAQMFVGSLRISNVARSSAEILANYNYTLGDVYGRVA